MSRVTDGNVPARKIFCEKCDEGKFCEVCRLKGDRPEREPCPCAHDRVHGKNEEKEEERHAVERNHESGVADEVHVNPREGEEEEDRYDKPDKLAGRERRVGGKGAHSDNPKEREGKCGDEEGPLVGVSSYVSHKTLKEREGGGGTQ